MKATSLLPAAVRKSYLRKFALAVGLIAVVVLSAGLVAEGAIATELTTQRTGELLTTTEQEAAALDQWVSEQREATRLLSNHYYISGATDTRIEATIKNERERRNRTVDEIHLVNLATGEIDRSSNESMVGTTLSEMAIAWDRGTLVFDSRNDVARSKVFLWDGDYHIAFASKVPDRTRAVVFTYDVSTRGSQFRSSIEGGKTQVLAANGEVQIAENESKILTRYADGTESEVVRASRNTTNGTVQGSGELFAYTESDETNWLVVKRVPVENAFAVRDQVEQYLFTLLGLALVGFVAFGAFVGRDIRRSLAAVTDRADALAAGRIDDDTADTERMDEIGQVEDAFGDIASYLQTVADQADALAQQEFDDPVLDRDVPGRLGESLAAMRVDLEGFIEEIEQAKTDAEQAQQEAEELAESLERQAEEFSTVMQAAADGDLSQRLDADTDNDAMREIATAFNEMIAQLGQTVVHIREFAADVEDSAEQISASATEVQNASEGVSQSVQEIAAGADQQHEHIQQASDEMSNLSATIEEVAAQADEVATTSREAAEIGETGRTRATDAVDVMNDIERRAETTIDRVESLDEEMARIGEIVDLIDDIAEQTNMLALNASIEAARAGEAGNGFAVVADEIKQLAEETGEATEEISAVISEVQSSTGDAVTDIRSMGDSVSEGIETVDGAIESLEAIVDRVEAVNEGMQSINDATDEQATATEQTVSMVDEIGSISEETASQAENVAASAEEQTATINEVNSSIDSLAGQATNLRSLLGQFDVETDQRTSGTDVYDPGTDEAAADDD
ncbi:methyl-accepting chemotaxis protein [Haloarcula pelagica]|uniref:methyl-accepting chemotaxis protein n=2 Tax=Haloarcula TaxID=2237 RepID=UPI0024C2B4E0|nr:methyl-accepting chemotaxis protein [Halomicroarcula sp. YJ-61-S]